MLTEPFTQAGVGSHFPVLAAAVARTTGPVLECGMGYWSSIMLYLMCKGKRDLLGLDSDPLWAGRFSGLYATGIIQGGIDTWVAYCQSLRDDIYQDGVIFVDNAPGEARVPMIIALKGKAKFIVVHDLEADIPPSAGNYGWKQLNGMFRYHTVFKDFRPWTGVFSDVEEFVL